MARIWMNVTGAGNTTRKAGVFKNAVRSFDAPKHLEAFGGVTGATTVSKRILFIQALPAALALVAYFWRKADVYWRCSAPRAASVYDRASIQPSRRSNENTPSSVWTTDLKAAILEAAQLKLLLVT